MSKERQKNQKLAGGEKDRNATVPVSTTRTELRIRSRHNKLGRQHKLQQHHTEINKTLEKTNNGIIVTSDGNKAKTNDKEGNNKCKRTDN